MRIPLLGLGVAAKSPAVTAKRLVNLYCEIRPGGEKSQIVAHGTPGLELFTDFGDTPVRGMRAIGDFLYVVHRGTLWQVNNAGSQVSRGTLATTTGRVDMADNGTQLIIVDGVKGYLYTIATPTFVQISDVDFFANPTTVTFQDGYFIVTFADSGRFQLSAAFNGANWDALDFASAESAPDNLVRVIADHGELCLFGEFTTEFWGNTGAQDFPYANVRGATIEHGLAARWSLAKFDASLAFLGKNRLGQVQVMRLQGYTPQAISTPDIDAIINGFPTVGDATAFSYMLGGHPMYELNFANANRSFLFDASTRIWSELKSAGARHKVEIHADFINKPRVSDYASGKVYSLSTDAYTDNGTAIEAEIVSENVRSPDGERFPVDCLRLDMETGVGLSVGQGSDPQVMLAVSRDGGFTYGSELWRTCGAIGKYGKRVEWRRLGSNDEWNFRLRITDPVRRTLISATINPAD